MNSGRLFGFEGYAQVNFFCRCAYIQEGRLLTLSIQVLQLVLLSSCLMDQLPVLSLIISLDAI